MLTTEQAVKSQFAKVFAESDWSLFKVFAEFNLREAAMLKSGQMAIKRPLRLLARNSRKRLLIGIGVELLLKAVYLKNGYAINKPVQGRQLEFPFTITDARGFELSDDKTFMLKDLISHLATVVQLSDKAVIDRGLVIAQVFRNKEGHSVTPSHQFDPSNYADIALALVALYQDAFGQRLSLRFSFAPNESPVWRLQD